MPFMKIVVSVNHEIVQRMTVRPEMVYVHVANIIREYREEPTLAIVISMEKTR